MKKIKYILRAALVRILLFRLSFLASAFKGHKTHTLTFLNGAEKV